MNISKILLTKRKERGITQKEAADYLGIRQQTLATWENENSPANISGKYIPKICELYKITSDELFSIKPPSFFITKKEEDAIKKYRSLDDLGKDIVKGVLFGEAKRFEQHHNQMIINTKSVPLYDLSVSAGNGIFTDNSNGYTKVQVPADVPQCIDFALKICGNSMEPDIPHGSVVWVKKQPYVMDGEVCIVIINGDGYCKIKTQQGFESINKDYKPILPYSDDNISVFGKVVKVTNGPLILA